MKFVDHVMCLFIGDRVHDPGSRRWPGVGDVINGVVQCGRLPLAIRQRYIWQPESEIYTALALSINDVIYVTAAAAERLNPELSFMRLVYQDSINAVKHKDTKYENDT